jgi:FdhE protein
MRHKYATNSLIGARTRLDAFARHHPEWRAWLRVLEETLSALDDPLWRAVAPQPRADRPPAAPLLDGAALTLDARRARRWVQRLLRAAAGEGPTAGAALDRPTALAVLEAAMCQDRLRVRQYAHRTGVDAQALEAIAHLAVTPLLHACARHVAAWLPQAWPAGYCPVCGAWPALAELCGIDRKRQLRCARCGGAWAAPWLRCVYCGEGNHQRLGSLLPEGREETQTVETCLTCHGYLKTLTTLQGAPPHMVALDDLATIDLDLVARAHGYTRPERPGFPLRVRIAERPRRFWPFFDPRRPAR